MVDDLGCWDFMCHCLIASKAKFCGKLNSEIIPTYTFSGNNRVKYSQSWVL